MFRAALLAIALIPAAAACSKGGDAGVTAADMAQAGDVREVSGTVTAHRGSDAPRALKVGDVVAGDDVVETGTDGSVVIELRHNGVRWSLGAGQSKQVSQSVAWQAPRGGGDEGGSDRDTAAGRHAERSAADTAETAVASMDSEKPGAPSPATTAVPTSAVTEPAPDTKPEHHAHTHATRTKTTSNDDGLDTRMMGQDSDGDLSASLSDSPKGGAVVSGKGGEGSGGIGSIGGGGGGGGSGGPPDLQPTDEAVRDASVNMAIVSVEGGLDSPTAFRTLLDASSRMKECGAKATGSGTVTLTLAIAADGSAKVKSASADDATAAAKACVVKMASRMKFPAKSDASTVQATVSFAK